MIVYKITNTINNKVYIGQTIRSIQIRWNEHIRYLKNGYHKNLHLQSAWNFYGSDIWKIEELGTAQTQNELNDLELYYIKSYNSIDRNYGYNIIDSRAIGSMPLETRQRISSARKGIVFSDETKKRMSIATKEKY